MKEQMHTGGEWDYDPGQHEIVTGEPSCPVIATLPEWLPQFHGERDANGRLMAAAPVQNDALIVAEYAISEFLADPSDLNREGLQLAHKKISAAIAKAKATGG